MQATGDRELVERARAGDESAYETLVRKHLRAAVAVALAVVRNQAEAEDVAQDSLVAAWEALDTCRDPERFAAWLFTIVRNRARNKLAARAVRQRDVAVEAEGTVEALEAVADRQRLLGALEQLSETQREVVLLHDLESWTHGEIAATLGLTEVNSRQLLFVARKALRALLQEEGADS